jgi:D-3-phosphoglycerate dehydrogenase / 2-oxoglutarate reductase
MPQRLVAVSDSVFPNLDSAGALLAKVGAEIRLAKDSTPEAILEVARDADALLTTYAKITGDMIRQMRNCRIISRFGIGIDNVDVPVATSQGIIVTRVPDYCLDEVSENAMALLLALARKIPFANSRTHAGNWKMLELVPIHRLRGRVLGLVAFGQIPRLVAPKAKAFGMRVVTYDPYVADEVLSRCAVERVDFDELVRISDFISIHTPLMPATHHLFNPDVFARMKPSAYVINTARGPIIDEAALAQALDMKQIAGAALDVMEQEPPRTSALFGRDNVILTPHTSFYSEESLAELQIKGAEEVVRVLTGQPPRNPVNPEVFKSAARS